MYLFISRCILNFKNKTHTYFSMQLATYYYWNRFIICKNLYAQRVLFKYSAYANEILSLNKDSIFI